MRWPAPIVTSCAMRVSNDRLRAAAAGLATTASSGSGREAAMHLPTRYRRPTGSGISQASLASLNGWARIGSVVPFEPMRGVRDSMRRVANFGSACMNIPTNAIEPPLNTNSATMRTSRQSHRLPLRSYQRMSTPSRAVSWRMKTRKCSTNGCVALRAAWSSQPYSYSGSPVAGHETRCVVYLNKRVRR